MGAGANSFNLLALFALCVGDLLIQEKNGQRENAPRTCKQKIQGQGVEKVKTPLAEKLELHNRAAGDLPILLAPAARL
jgi:hypothetical protein